jgi:hypothetical protein
MSRNLLPSEDKHGRDNNPFAAKVQTISVSGYAGARLPRVVVWRMAEGNKERRDFGKNSTACYTFNGYAVGKSPLTAMEKRQKDREPGRVIRAHGLVPARMPNLSCWRKIILLTGAL